MTYQIGDKIASYTGRDSFPVDDATFKAQLLATGCFTEQEDGELRYSGSLVVKMKDGTTRDTDARGFMAVEMADLDNPTHPMFR